MQRQFAITFDYLCPFARNGNEHVIEGLRADAPWDVEFLPYSLAQGHVEADQTDVWERPNPDEAAGILALQAGLATRDHRPENFPDVHEALFAARHDHGRDLKDPQVVRDALTAGGVDADEIFDIIAGGEPMKTLRAEHEAGARDHEVWGVPTFIAGDRAVFVRVLDRPEGDGQLARTRIEQIIDLVVGSPMIHEFKQTDLPM